MALQNYPVQRKSKKKKIFLITAVVIVALLAGLIGADRLGYINLPFFPDNNNHESAPVSDQSSSNSSEEKSFSNTNPDVAPLQQDSTPSIDNSLPTPVLTKSAGNGPPAPLGVTIRFTCSAPAGYECLLTLEDTNGKAVSFEKKRISTDGRGQTIVEWDWETIGGTWDAEALVYKSDNFKPSGIQRFEVK